MSVNSGPQFDSTLTTSPTRPHKSNKASTIGTNYRDLALATSSLIKASLYVVPMTYTQTCTHTSTATRREKTRAFSLYSIQLANSTLLLRDADDVQSQRRDLSDELCTERLDFPAGWHSCSTQRLARARPRLHSILKCYSV